ncbi:SseB family protein [Roseitranquillus sediminis]|uniref:SseB family protein n=1 Tax=Roseitranquillus sediminis TaxID=2809051 RepID=UPI001D0C8625|nr:SseB family protein [Roseitranquillus sediminis]MBM9594518.1 SseB family protein [Roseitranquillus sediminis]
MTDLADALEAMAASPDDDALRLRFYARLADSEVHLLLDGEAEAGRVAPRSIEHDGHPFVLAFTSEERLAEFAAKTVDHATLSGRALVQMLVASEAGLTLDLGISPAGTMLPPEAISWLAGTLLHRPAEVSERPAEVRPPRDVPDTLREGLAARLAAAGGLAREAWLAEALYEGGRKGWLLLFVDAPDERRRALAHAVGEALTFSGLEAGVVDVTFAKGDDPLVARLARVAMLIDLPKAAPAAAPAAPGRDPDRPPRVR